MRGKPAGATVWLRRFCWEGGDPPRLGMYLVTEAGSGYRVDGIEELGPGRFDFLCTKVDPALIPAGADAAAMFWTRRA